jgi:hypothetical protein
MEFTDDPSPDKLPATYKTFITRFPPGGAFRHACGGPTVQAPWAFAGHDVHPYQLVKEPARVRGIAFLSLNKLRLSC